MSQDPGRILTTHVGSLIRPDDFAAMIRAQMHGEPVDQASFDARLKSAVLEVTRQQAEAGLDIINDGEFGKTISWADYLVERVGGIVQEPPSTVDFTSSPALYSQDMKDFADFYAGYFATQEMDIDKMVGWVVREPLRYTGQAAINRDIADLKAALNGVEHVDAFMPSVAPGSALQARRDEYYKSEEDYLQAIAEVLREEYRAIVDAGFIVQVDDAYLATTYDVMVPGKSLEDYRRWAGLRVEALNHALEGIPIERTRYHVCWGSWNGPHVTDVELKHIVDLILQVRVGGYALEMANPRHEHEWRVWENVKLPEGRKLIPGVISHSTNVVEHPELVAERLTRLARLVGRENVIGGTDCGFAQTPYLQRVHPTIQWAKLKALAEGARLASRELWGKAAA